MAIDPFYTRFRARQALLRLYLSRSASTETAGADICRKGDYGYAAR